MKKIIAILCALCMTASLAACNNTEEERHNALMQEISTLSEQITSLNQQITSLNEQIDTLTGEMDSLKEQQSAEKEALTEQLEAQIEEMELMQKRLKNLMGVPIEYTAEAPVFLLSSIRSDYTKVYEISTDRGDTYDTYSLAKEYYQTSVQPNLSEDIYLLKHIGEECIHPSCYYRDYHFYTGKENAAFPFVINTYMRIYVDELGRIEDIGTGEGYHPWSLEVCAYLLPVPKDQYKRYTYRGEFGFNPNKSSRYTHYINVYAQKGSGQEVCVATYYYLPNAYISKSWFEDYFYYNLVKIV